MTGAAALAARDLAFRYGDRTVLDGVGLDVAAGELRIVLGPNGSGKSTLLRLLAGLLQPARGAVEIDGDRLADLSRREVARRVAWLPQSIGVAFGFGVRRFVTLARYPHLAPLAAPTAADRAAVDEALATVGASDLADRDLSTLSGGERQRIHLAGALAQAAPVLLLDEPTASLDPRHAIEIGRLLERLRREEGRTIVLVTHDLVLAGRFADRLLLLADGRVAADGRTEEVLTEEILEAVYGVSWRRIDARTLLPGDPR